jgi:hypothetical protein
LGRVLKLLAKFPGGLFLEDHRHILGGKLPAGTPGW